MISQRLIRLVAQNADRLSNDLIVEVRRDPRTTAYHKLSEEDLDERAHDLFRNLGQWLSSRTEFALQNRYEAFGRRRCQEGIPFSQLLFALNISKNMLLSFIRGAAAAESASELPLEYELSLSITQFYDKAIYHAAAGYEAAARASAEPPPVELAVTLPGNEVTRKPLSREVTVENHDLGLEVSRSGDIGESGG
jgi:hypothetical protein